MTRTHIDDRIISLGAATLLGYFESGSPEWLAARDGVGGSDVGGILGLNPWASPFTTYHRMTGALQVESNEAMALGSFFEAPIRDWFANQIEGNVFTTGTWANLEQPWKKANPDAIIEWHDGSLSILEIKMSKQRWSQLPPMYEAQVRWYMHVLGIKTSAVVAALCAGEFKVFEVLYDADLECDMMLEITNFWNNNILENKAPDWDGAANTYETVVSLAPGIVDEEASVDLLWGKFVETERAEKIAASNHRMSKIEVLRWLDGRKYGTVNGERVVSIQTSSAGTQYLRTL